MRDLLPYLSLYRKHWFGLTLGMLLGFITLAASIGLLTLSGWFISAAAVAGLSIARETFNYMLPGGGVRGLAMTRTAGRWGERVVSHNATFKLLADLRIFFFERLAPLIPGKIGNLRDGDVLNRLVADVEAMDHLYLRLISPVTIGLLGIAGLTALLAWFDTSLALLLGAILLVMTLVWPVLFYHLGKRNGRELTEHRAQFRIAMLDWLQGFSELTLFGAERHYRDAFLAKQASLLRNQWAHAHITGLASALLILVNGLTLVVILWFAADGVNGQAPDPIVALFAFAAMASFELLMPLAGAFQYLGQTLTSAKRLNDILLTTPEVQFPAMSAQSPTSHHDALVFDNVQFHYAEGKPAALHGLNLAIAKGQKVAILGQTGSGKSTLLQLVSRYWDPQQGLITLNGVPLPQWSETELRQSMTVVSQRVDILNGTLRDNLLLAAPEANDDALVARLQDVELDTLLEGKGLDAWLGDGGRQLSGGERRRIGIARALLRDAPILLLDEPTEGLDKQTEAHIMALLARHYQTKTVLFVTHRLIALEQMDSICLMEQGAIVEQGSHAELLAEKGRYYQLWQSIA
ncbi:cysteine/glutathione ABC transporter ATP-binding protein/permease CydC [Vibrio sp. SM6]|uniref:Glutathione/L-cysteine transport system ATP-binding/permease protein CydC n=1 Tax=Vibrio agarilyticus TaxID=2726741 RepID=A0A7X8TM93_9VIBR|nr:cysteine/glutathione ABC transporter ATP-binding protein/permease CydC [Vibrio agarilyticus]NLS11367.1 cysteine/glutathione ABC transporter ATP-binding protein/permease CydC [Vibrio agarilyticus]